MNFLDFFLISETTTIQDILLNPANDDLYLDEILLRFKKHGGKVAGKGAFAMVLDHPSWNYVLKLFKQDIAYLRFVRFVLQNPRPSFPKFYDKPRKIYPRFMRSLVEESLYYLKIEKLVHLSKQQFNIIEQCLNIKYEYTIEQLNDIIAEYKGYIDGGNDASYIYNDIAKYETIRDHKINNTLPTNNPNVLQLLNDIDFLRNHMDEYKTVGNTMGDLDLHDANIMKRSDGTYVISDPLAYAISPGSKAKAKKYSDIYKIPDPKLTLPGGKKLKY